MGRPPIGKKAMSGAERIRRWREKQPHATKPAAAREPPRSKLSEFFSQTSADLQRRVAELEKQLAHARKERPHRPQSEIEQELRKEISELRLRLKRAEMHIETKDGLASGKGVIPRSMFRKLLGCFHADRSFSDETLNECFVFLKDLEHVLVKADERPPTKAERERKAREEAEDAAWRAKRQRQRQERQKRGREQWARRKKTMDN